MEADWPDHHRLAAFKEVLTIADDLDARGIGVRILTGKLSGSYSPARASSSYHDGRVRRAGAGHHPRAHHASLAAAKAQGRACGRPTVMDADKLAAARRAGPAARARHDRQGPRRQPRLDLPARGR